MSPFKELWFQLKKCASMEIQTHLNLFFPFVTLRWRYLIFFVLELQWWLAEESLLQVGIHFLSAILIQTFIQLFLCFEADPGQKALWVLQHHSFICGL